MNGQSSRKTCRYERRFLMVWKMADLPIVVAGGPGDERGSAIDILSGWIVKTV